MMKAAWTWAWATLIKARRGGTRPTSNYLTAWRSEQACPEVLPWRGDLVDALLDAAEQQEAMVKATVEQGGDVDECLFSAPLYESELRAVPFCGWQVRALSITEIRTAVRLHHRGRRRLREVVRTRRRPTPSSTWI